MSTTSHAPPGTQFPAALADNLRARRLELGLSQAELARYVSPSCRPADIDSLESRRTIMPSWIRLKQLADALEMPASDLLPTNNNRDRSTVDSSADQTAPSTNP